jgi:hypothetical protein
MSAEQVRRLREDLAVAVAERDRLRVVVDDITGHATGGRGVNADELDAAREAVSATRTWRDQMRADWGTNFREPEEVLDEAVGKLLAERNRLRAVVDAVRRLSHLYRIAESVDFDDITPVTVAMERVDVLLRQLDVSPNTGDRCPDCGNPLRYCDCPDVSPNTGEDR